MIGQTLISWYGADALAATSDGNDAKEYAIPMPKGQIWQIDEFGVRAGTNYAAADTSYQTFYLKDTSGNTIASVANGPAATGLAIGPVATGKTTTMSATYKKIDARTATTYIYVDSVPTGSGRAMVHVGGWVLATPIGR